MSDVSSGTLNVINVVRHYILGDGKVFPRHQHVRHATIILYSIKLRLSFAKLLETTHNQPSCVRQLRNETELIHYRPTHNLTHTISIFVLVILYIYRAYY